MTVKKDLDTIVNRLEPDAAVELTPAARGLMHDIMATARPAGKTRRARLRPQLAIPAVTLIAAAALALSWVLPSGSGLGPAPVAALDIKQENGYYIIEINDFYANPDVYQKQLRAYGLDVTLRVLPSTAAFVGQVFPIRPNMEYIEEIKGIYPPGECDRVDGCAIGVKIPTDFTGTADIAVSRAAKPGEKYQSTTIFAAKGEPLHCVPHLNHTVAEVRELLRERGVTIEEFMTNPGGTGDPDMRASVPDTWYVVGGYLTEPGKATVMAADAKMPQEKADSMAERLCDFEIKRPA